jgi:hypothetical protein
MMLACFLAEVRVTDGSGSFHGRADRSAIRAREMGSPDLGEAIGLRPRCLTTWTGAIARE